MTTRPISTLLRTSGQLLARFTGRGERPAERVRRLMSPAETAATENVASRISQASAGQAPTPRKSRAPAGGPTVEGRHHTVANLALRRTGVLPPEARVPQAATSPAALSRPTLVAAAATATREIPKPSSSFSAPRANSAFLSRRSISHSFPRINVTPQEAAAPARRGNTGRFAGLQPSFERGSVATPDSLERTLRFQPVRTAPMQNRAPAQKTLRWTRKITFSLAALLALTFTAAHADSRPDFNRDAKPILRSQPQLLHYVKVHFDVQETGYARSPGDESHAPAPPYIFRAKPHGADGPYTITLFIQPGAPGHILYVKKTGPLAAESNPPASAYPPGENPAPYNPAGEPPASASSDEASAPSTPATPNGFVGVDSSTPSGPIKPSANATAPDLAPPPETAPTR